MGKKEKIRNKDQGQKRNRKIICSILPFLFLLLIYIPPWLFLEKHIQSEILFGLCLILCFFITRKLGWDEKSLLAVLSGYLFCLSVPDVNLFPFCFTAFIPLFIALDKSEDFAHSFLYGVISAFSTIFLCLSWLKIALANLCGISEFHALFIVLPFCVLLNLKYIFFSLIYHWNKQRLKLPVLLFLPFVFAILELFKWEFYPWYMAIFLSKTPSLLQIMDITGLPGIAFFIMFINLCLYSLWRYLRKEEAKFPLKKLIAGFSVFLVVFIYGQIRIYQIKKAENNATETLNIAAVQPDSPLKVLSKDTDLKKEICDNLYKLAGEAVKKGKPDLIVFAEGSTTIGYQAGYNPEFRDVFNRIARDYDTPILFDNIHFVSSAVYYRSAVLLSPDGEIMGEYLKRKLAPFGEYIPLESVFPGLRKIFKYAKNYKTGKDYTLLEINGIPFVPQICFESIHPAFTRRFVKKGGRLIINMTNDMWFGEREAKQHLALSTFRCIENRVPMVRVTNNGISAYISATGIPLILPSQYNATWTYCKEIPKVFQFSFYRLWGDFFGYICILIVIFLSLKKEDIMRFTKVQVNFLCGAVFTLSFASGCSHFTAKTKGAPEIVSVKKIWDKAPYNSFTDLAFFNSKWFCAFREGNTHWGKGDCGKIRIITSTNGENWESAALLSEEGADLRDAKLSITPDNRLMLLYFRRFNPTAYPEKHEKSFACFSKDGFLWDEPVEVGTTERWLWRVTWHKEKAFGIDYGGPDGAPPFQAPRTGRLYSSNDGIHFKTLIEFEHAGESATCFMDDDTALSLIRSKGDNAILGTARPPYLDWTWKDLNTRLGGPNLIKLPNGRIVAAGRLYDEPIRTSLLWLDPQKGILEEFLTFPSGGDTSYPGLVWKDGLLWVSYYSSHEGKSSIYLAKVKIP